MPPLAPSHPGALAHYIEATHHAYLHAEVPALAELARKVNRVHGARHPELSLVEQLVQTISAELAPHLSDEEEVVFPAARVARPADRGLLSRIHGLRADHDRLGTLLAQLHAAANSYVAPSDGCGSYRSLYDRLDHLEADTHVHIHLENNVLFPALERSAHVPA